MIQRWLSQSAVLVIVTGAAGPALGGDYLRTVGPPPLRFEMPPVAATTRFLLPPLEDSSTNSVAGTAGKTNPPPTLAAPLGTTPPAAPPDLSIAEPEVATAIAPSWPTNVAPFTTPDAPLSPQMFMHYFARGTGTNGPAASVLIPMNFLPPVPLVVPSSSAVYEVTPPPKP